MYVCVCVCVCVCGSVGVAVCTHTTPHTGLQVVGTGHRGSLEGVVVRHDVDFAGGVDGLITICGGRIILLADQTPLTPWCFRVFDRETLVECDEVPLGGDVTELLAKSDSELLGMTSDCKRHIQQHPPQHK